MDATFGTSAINLQNLRNEIQRMLEMARVNVEEVLMHFWQEAADS